MGFVIGRIAWILLQPMSLAFACLIIGRLAGMIGFSRCRSFLTGLAILILFVTMFTTAGQSALARLENRFPKPVDPQQALSCMIILGGAIDAPVSAARGGYEMGQAADRFIEGLRLARLYPGAKIIVSGGDGSFSGTYDGDAIVSERFFSTFGIDPARLIKETKSRTTSENTDQTSQLLKDNGLDNCALVTSAYHMPRALGLFERRGINVQPWPVDYRTTGDIALRFDFTQPSLNIQLASTAAREWSALTIAYLSGETLQLLAK